MSRMLMILHWAGKRKSEINILNLLRMITLLSVLKAFEFKGLNKDAYYKPEDILAALDKLGGKEFNREVADQLFNQCPTNNLKY